MFGDRLKQLRESKDLKQSELAKELGIGRTTLSHYELNNRQPDFNTLEKIANYFNVSIDYLLGNSTKKDSDEIDELEQEFKEIRDKLKNISPHNRKKILKMIELFEEDENKE